MADISKITLLDGQAYDIKDAVARAAIPAAATNAPQMDGSAAVGTSTKYAKEDHRHPRDTSLFFLKCEGTSIASNTDLNDLRTPGNYYCSSISTAPTILNCPPQKDIYNPFKLAVIEASSAYWMFMQLMIVGPGESIYCRFYYGGDWHDWFDMCSPTTVNGHTVESNVPANAVFTDTTYTPASATPLMDGTAAVGTSENYAREDHVHPKDSSMLALDQFGTEFTSDDDLDNFITPGNYYTNNPEVTQSLLHRPSQVSDYGFSCKLIVLKIGRANSGNPILYQFYLGGVFSDATIYMRSRATEMVWTAWVCLTEPTTVNGHTVLSDVPTNAIFTDTTYESKAAVSGGTDESLVTTGEKAIWNAHTITNKGSAFTSGLYKIATNSEGHVTSATAVVKSDITALGIPESDTTYTPASAAPGKIASASSTGTSTNYARQDHTHGIDLATGDSDGQVKIAGQNVSVKGLKSLAYADSVTMVNGHYVLSNVPANAVFTDTTYTPASANPLMDGTAAVGTSTKYAREDHVHPRDSKVAALTYDVTEINTGDDLDDYITPGTYYCATATIASNVSNIPEGVGAAFKLYVIGIIPSRYYQLLLFNNDAHLMFYRYYYDGSWFSWHEVDNPSKVNGHTVLSNVPANLAFNCLYYGECSTAAATVAKTVTLTNGDGFSLVEGAKICVRFEYANSASSPTLNVNDTGAKAIVRFGTTVIGTTAGGTGNWSNGGMVLFIYDGTSWVEHYWNNTTYSSMTVAEYTAGTATTGRLMTAARLKGAIKLHSAPDVYTATIPTTGWTTASYGAYIDVTFTGATFAADDTVFVDLNLSDDTNLQLINDSWACLLRATPTASSAIIRFNFREVPTVAIPVRAVVK